MLSLKNLFPKFNTFEKLLWTISVAGVTVLFMFVPQKNPLTLIATITGVTSLIFVAKGNVIGQFLIVVFSVLYSIVSLEFHYYGEMITYLFMSTPSAIFTAVLWLKNPAGTQKIEVKMAHLTPKKSAVALITPYIWYEGYPMNIAECFSMGVPVVSTSIGNAGDLVSKSNAGTLFDFEVKGSFRKALDAVYEQRTKFSFNAYNYYLCNQTPASNYERLNKIYDTL